MGDGNGYNNDCMPAATLTAHPPGLAFRSKRLLALAGDERLVEQIRRGNEAAFEVAFERHGAGILAFCRHMLGSQQEAEDAVQHTFAAAYRNLVGHRAREIALKPWLYAIARNRCISVLRARRAEFVQLDGQSTPGIEHEVEQRAELRHILADVRELPDEQRAALLLTEVADLSHAEVARVLGCEAARVKALVYRARSGLIERRDARETPCAEIREQLANLRGGALRRSRLRHHLSNCPGCSAYREQVRRQRQLLAAALPIVPSASLHEKVLAAAGVTGSGAAGAAGVLGSGAVGSGAAGGALGSGAAGGGVLGSGAAGAAGAGAAGSGLLGGGAALGTALGSATLAKVAIVGVLAGGGLVAADDLIDPQRAAELPASAPAATEAPLGAGEAPPSALPGVSQGRAFDAPGRALDPPGVRMSTERSHGRRGAEQRAERAGDGGAAGSGGAAKENEKSGEEGAPTLGQEKTSDKDDKGTAPAKDDGATAPATKDESGAAGPRGNAPNERGSRSGRSEFTPPPARAPKVRATRPAETPIAPVPLEEAPAAETETQTETETVAPE